MLLPADSDAQHFWKDSACAAENHTEAPPTDELIARVEAALGYWPSTWR